MTAATPATPGPSEPMLSGRTVVVIGGSAGIGLETARLARGEGAEVVLVGRDPDRLGRAAALVGARSTAAFDATDPETLERFFHDLPGPVDHVMTTAGGPFYGPLADMDLAEARRHIGAELTMPLHLARAAVGKVRPPGRCCSWAAPAPDTRGAGRPPHDEHGADRCDVRHRRRPAARPRRLTRGGPGNRRQETYVYPAGKVRGPHGSPVTPAS